MCIWTGRNRLPRCHCRKKSAKDGSQENQRCSWLENPHKSHRNSPVLRIYWILLLFHTQLLQNCTTTLRPYKEGYSMEMDRLPFQGLWRIEDAHVPATGPYSNRLSETLLPPSRCLCLWPGGCTLTGGKIIPHPSKTLKTSTTSHCILLSHFYTYRTQPQHLWARTTSCDAVPSALETIPGLDKGTLHHPHWPQKLAILEVPSKAQQTNSKMACRPAGIWLWNPVHPWENKHPCRCSL